jgi:hypothetical protein
MTDVSAPTVEPQPAPPPSNELAEIRETLSRLEKGGEYEIPALVDADAGHEKKVYSGIQDSAWFLARSRREKRAADPVAAAADQLEQFTDQLHYTDDREVDAKQAAADIAKYRADKAKLLLEGIQPEAPEPALQRVRAELAKRGEKV